ncbi:nucleoside hydrolase [Corynebacterium sp. sy017]|uniref:nucleoside hydrolase n=1 Tax=unclassified Corynebacterium TaxID=2624378 RepID=UPI0011865808|nr:MULTISPECIES: nucleoside hydrolase [unclassified Corynebacterium]MBP3088293.1 nucleoside hydrolase [Corynebacterium sp. sy017]TSD91617.1 nucleoside hydrolase [Corynebacterium sp. SY003]
MSKVPFILDTDTAQDDCVAILLGLLSERADFRAITMVAGNVGFDRQISNAHMTLNAAGKLGEVPIFAGCSQPMLRPWSSAEDVHGDGAGGLTMDFSGTSVEDEHAVDALLRITAENPGEISIVAIGPLTNIATAVVKDRSFVQNVKSLHIMGGSNNGRGNITPAAEFNFYVDPEAAQIVFNAGFENIVVMPWDPVTFNDATLPRAQYNEKTAVGTPIAQFFKAVCDTTLDFDEAAGINGSTHPDSMTLATLLYPELIQKSARYRVDVETNSDLTRGYSAMAWEVFDVQRNATVIEKADREQFFGLIDALLNTHTTPNRKMWVADA